MHGLLHLLATTTKPSAAASWRMQAHEDALLASLGYDGLYEHGR